MMKKKTFFAFVLSLLSITIVEAQILSTVEFYHPMDIDMIKIGLEDEDQKYEIVNESLIIHYKDFLVIVKKDGAFIACNTLMSDCLDNSTFRSVLQDLEDWNAYDLSKDDKDTIASLYRPGVIIRRMNTQDLLFLRIKGFIGRLLGKMFCVNYEKSISCKDEWCALELVRSDGCLYFKTP